MTGNRLAQDEMRTWNSNKPTKSEHIAELERRWELMRDDRNKWKRRVNEPYDDSVIAELEAKHTELRDGLRELIEVLDTQCMNSHVTRQLRELLGRRVKMGEDSLHGKYLVKRSDGKPLKGQVFVLSPETDEAAMQALATYQECIEGKNPELAHDLGIWLAECGFIHSDPLICKESE